MRAATIWQRLKRVYITGSVVFTTATLAALIGGASLLVLAPEKLPAPLTAKIDTLKYAAKDWNRQLLGAPGQRAAHFPPIEQWRGQGARVIDAPLGTGRLVPVASPQALQAAVKNALPGDVIRLAPGTYRLQGRNIEVRNGGLPDKPITLEAGRLGDAVVELDMLEGFLISEPYWIVQHLDIRGACKDDSDCEHAFHIVGNGHHTVIRNNRVHEFNAPIKANGVPINGVRIFPDQGTIAHNSFYASRKRNTGNPVAFIDMVGVSAWTVQGNLIADFAKGDGNKISYGAYFKGGGERNVFEKNLVICAMHVPQSSDEARVGLSFGGGGSSPDVCRANQCSPEHHGGVMRHNIVLHCTDVGIYLNRAANTAVVNNTLFDTLGIDVRFPESVAMLANNLLDNRIAMREGGSAEQIANAVVASREFDAWFTDAASADFSFRGGDKRPPLGNPLREGQTDFCGTPIRPPVVAGAIQPSAACRPNRMADDAARAANETGPAPR